MKGELPMGNSPFDLFPPTTAYYRLLPPFDRLRQPALLPRGSVPVDQVLAAGPVQELDGLSVRLGGSLSGGGADLLDRGAELASLRPVELGGGFRLAHTLLG